MQGAESTNHGGPVSHSKHFTILFAIESQNYLFWKRRKTDHLMGRFQPGSPTGEACLGPALT
jgi:hypothetical protein